MPDWQLSQVQDIRNYGKSATTSGTTTTAGGSAHTKGAWVQLVAATDVDAEWIMVCCCNPSTFSQDGLIDIGIGGSGSEVVIVPNLLLSSLNDRFHLQALYHIKIPAGTRISARWQSTSASLQIKTLVMIGAGTFSEGSGCAKVIDLGTVTATTRGTSIDPGAVANTKGAWVQMTAAVDGDVRELTMGFGGQRNTARTAGFHTYDVGIGAAASEVVIVPDIPVEQLDNDDLPSPIITPTIPVNIPSGTRIAVRGQSSVTDATDRLMDVVLHCSVA